MTERDALGRFLDDNHDRFEDELCQLLRIPSISTESEYAKSVTGLLDKLTDRETHKVAYTLNGHLMGYTPTTTNAASALLIRLRLGADKGDSRVKKALPGWGIRASPL